MSELEKTKHTAINSLENLCARCREGLDHSCPVSELILRIKSISGIPVIVNDKLRHVVFN